MGAGIEHEIGYDGRAACIERLLKARRIKAGANRVRSDDSDGLALVARRGNEARGLTRGVNLSWFFSTHFKFLCSTSHPSPVRAAVFKTLN